jgi:hypothetical protein
MYKKFILNIAFFIIPIVIIILSINIKVDGGFVINNRSNQIAKILVSGKNAAIKYIPSRWGNLQIAIVEEHLKFNDTLKKDIIVFGTSRSSEINSDFFKQNTFFNCIIPGGNILDYIALYGLYKRHKMLPKYLFISIDPWTFHSRTSITVNNKNFIVSDTSIPLNVNRDLITDYVIGLSYLGLKSNLNNRMRNNNLSIDDVIGLLNPNYFQLNLWSIFDTMVIETNKFERESYFVIRSDGGYSLAKQSKIDSLAVINRSEEFIKINKSNFFVSSDTASIYWGYFRKLLNNIKDDGVFPIVYISPLNPIVFDNLSDSSKVIIEEKIDVFCNENKIIRIGSFNPHKYGFNRVSNYFMDAYHPVKQVVDSIFKYHTNELNTIGIKTR